MIRLAGEIADGVILNSLPTQEHIQFVKGALQQGAERGGRDPGGLTIASSVIYSVSDDLDEAVTAAKEDVLFYLGYPEIDPILEQSGLMDVAEAIRRTNRERGKEAALDLITPPLLDSLAVYGNAERCREGLKALMAAGIDLPIIRVSNVPYAEKDKKRVFLRAIESLRDF